MAGGKSGSQLGMVAGVGWAMSQPLHFKTGMMIVIYDSSIVEKPMFHGNDLFGHHQETEFQMYHNHLNNKGSLGLFALGALCIVFQVPSLVFCYMDVREKNCLQEPHYSRHWLVIVFTSYDCPLQEE